MDLRAIRLQSRYRKGVTLVEVVMASSLLLIGVVPILRAMTIAQATGRQVEYKTKSLILAQGQISEIRTRSLTEFSTSFDQSSADLGDGYLCTLSDNEHATCKTVSVSVGYDQNGNGALSTDEIQVTLTTLIALRTAL